MPRRRHAVRRCSHLANISKAAPATTSLPFWPLPVATRVQPCWPASCSRNFQQIGFPVLFYTNHSPVMYRFWAKGMRQTDCNIANSFPPTTIGRVMYVRLLLVRIRLQVARKDRPTWNKDGDDKYPVRRCRLRWNFSIRWSSSVSLCMSSDSSASDVQATTTLRGHWFDVGAAS